MRPMWQLLQMLVCRTISRMLPCLLFAKDFGVDGSRLGLSGFDQYFEIQILTRFGISLNFNECVFCHRVGQAFDFSFKYGACLCSEHYHEDERRCHLNPNILICSINFKPLILRPWRPFRSSPISSKTYASLWISSTKSTLGFT